MLNIGESTPLLSRYGFRTRSARQIPYGELQLLLLLTRGSSQKPVRDVAIAETVQPPRILSARIHVAAQCLPFPQGSS